MKKTFHLGDNTNASRDVQSEIELHLELRAKEFEALGMSAEDARKAAVEAFGDRNAIQSEVTELRTTTVKEKNRRNWREELQQDVVVGLRGLRRAPAFTVVALLTLAIGIGANTAIFSALRSLLLRPLPYAAPEQLVQLWTDHRALGRAEPEWLTPPDFEEWRDQSTTFSTMAAYLGWGPDMTGTGDPEALGGAMVSGNYFDMLGIKPALGRLLSKTDDDAAAEQVVVMSDALWKRRFGSDPAIVGRKLTLNGQPWTIVGVLPATFRAPMQSSPELFRAIRRPLDSRCNRGCITVRAIGRLKPGVTFEAAQADLSRIAAQQAREFPQTNDKVGAWPVPLHQQLTGDSKPALFMLAGAVALVLLIGCVNLANLLLVRGAGRARELGVRAALGAGQHRIVRQLLVENALLATLGGVLGIGVGIAGSRILSSIAPEAVRLVQDIRVDGPVLLFALGVTALSALLFGLLPAMQTMRLNLMSAIRSGTRETAQRGGALRSGLVIAQLSFAVVLLVGAGLLFKSFLLMQRVDLGYRSEGVFSTGVAFPSARYENAAKIRIAVEAMLAALRADPAIKSAEITTIPPLSSGDQDISPVPLGEPPNPSLPPSVWYRQVSAGYMQALHMKLVEGRQLADADRDGTERVAIVNQIVAQKYFPNGSAIGRVMALGTDSGAPRVTIVGVAANVRTNGPNEPYKPEMFVPFMQAPARTVAIFIEPRGTVAAAVQGVRKAVASIDPLIPINSVETIDEQLGTAVALPKMYAMLVTSFAVVALLLAALGVYGVMADSVAQRQREIGVRLALGAPPSRILSMVLGQGGRLAIGGVLLGLAGALMLGRLVTSLLFGVTSFDITTFAGVGLVLGAMTLLAAYVPARRAMRVDPNTAIRDC